MDGISTAYITAIQIPPNVLTAGSAYIIAVRATYNPGNSVENAPLNTHLAFGYADAYSGVITP